MSYIKIDNKNSFNHSSELIPFYEENIVKIAKILNRRVEDIPRGITLHIEEGGVGAGYSHSERKIVYRVAPNGNVLDDRGRLIHEAVHVVQDYTFESNRNKVTRCWTEGIADYCRAKLDETFDVTEGQMGDPEKGYKEAACFLIWLSKFSPTVVADFNRLLAENGHEISSHDQIFPKLEKIKKQYRTLLIEYFSARKKFKG